ncbi:SSU ribosomal protein S4P [Isosphaera pallida ATCC 43644]|uniref:Small ribosomal subunit protein uS4 n=1 Tax=Isosphaera pallida (strain ATCC 43644 / DSM 9630 / IS1B) TaxID=575540 RepID=E8R482_ISOPI|nr:30S ribosomal protein S4 [Isosphaera pallida]ADV62683.1 SSU ribosomal protein S4P [Isosphaera pallida ATCC 43644]
MGRYTGPVCRLCRREGIKLYLKGTRCDSPKCAIERRQTVPGMHQTRRGKASEYAKRLREKQKVKRYYGVYERQFRKYYAEANRLPGNTGERLMALLERRLDNVVTRLGFAISRPQARQLISHGHILVNGRKLDIPSYLVRAGESITLKDREHSRRVTSDNLHQENLPAVPDWLERISEDPPEGRVSRLPSAQDISLPVQPQLIVELLSR